MKVYLSSTLNDLGPERQAVKDALSGQCIVVESYKADERSLRESCLADVAGCDLYIGIVGLRYGFVPEGETLSITHLEYEKARGTIPTLIFIKDVDTIKYSHMDVGTGEQPKERIESFRDQLTNGTDVASRPAVFKTTDELKFLILDAYNGFLKRRGETPLSNWPQQVIESLSKKFNEEFADHLRAGEDLSADQVRDRYVRGVIKLRDEPGGASALPKDRKPSREGPLEDFLSSDGVQLLIIGAGGGGKTSMLLHLAAEGAFRATSDSRAPIFVYLRLASFDRGDGGLDLLFNRLSLAAHLDQKDFEMRWRQGPRPIVFLLDGLNEVARAYQPSCATALRTLLQNSLPQHRYVITSRPGSELEAMSQHSTENQRLWLADILKFGPQEVQRYLQAQGLTELQPRISGRLEDLASNPFLLWAISRTLANTRQPSPTNRGSLFRALIDDYIFGQREQSKPKPRPTDYNYELVKKPVLAQLARRMFDDGVTVVADGPALSKQVAKCLRDLDQQREQERELPLEPEIFMPKEYAAASCLREILENGMLVRDGDGLRFMHESVQEYFAAVALRTSSVEELEQRAPSRNLTRLNARGPKYETLVTWAGLSTPGQVTELVEVLHEKHPLLAAEMAVEAGLPEEKLQKLRHQFLSLSKSEHEQRQRLGAMGLAIIPSEEPEVLARLLEMLDVYKLSEIAEQALTTKPSKDTLSAVVRAWAKSSNDVHSKGSTLLRKMAITHSALVTEVLFDVWCAADSLRDRVAELTSFVDAPEKWEKDRRPLIRENLITLAVDAELAGDLQRSADLDALRQRAEQVLPARGSIESATERMVKSIKAFAGLSNQREELATAHTGKDDAALELLVRDGTPLEHEVALTLLVKRGSLRAVEHIIEAVLNTPKRLHDLEFFPREALRSCLANRIATLEGPLLERARLLAALLADKPSRAVLESVFQEGGEELRTFAVRAAARAGTEGVELLIAHLDVETSDDVLVACVKALGESRNPIALNHLLDLLFDPVPRQHWGFKSGEDLVSDPELNSSTSSDGWAALIHVALADAGAANQILERLDHHLRQECPRDTDQAVNAVHEARRWLPAARAVELLGRAMTHQDPWVRQWAQWSLACTGHVDAWRALLQTELETPPDFVGFAQDAARRLEETTTSATRDALVAASESIVRRALADRDEKRRATALELTRRMPERWIGSDWQTEAVSTAEHLLASAEKTQRLCAIRVLRRFANNADDRIFTILMNEPDEDAARSANEMLGNAANARLEERVQSVLQAGDSAVARDIAGRIRTLLRYSTKELGRIRDAIAPWLDTGNRDQSVAALLALTMLHTGYDDETEWEQVAKRARAAFQRLGIEDVWRQFALHAHSVSETHRGFIYLVFGAFDEALDQLATLVKGARELWPDDLLILAYCVVVDIDLGNRDQAAKQITLFEEQFRDRVSYSWLADMFEKLGQPQDALRASRIAVEREPNKWDAHFKVGWFAFLTGDFDGSIEATRRGLTLQPTSAMAEFNLGVALLASGDIVAAEAAYRRGVALARRSVPAIGLQVLEGAVSDFAILPDLPDAPKAGIERIRTWLESERDRLASAEAKTT